MRLLSKPFVSLTAVVLVVISCNSTAAVFSVCSRGCDFTSIQTAHDAVMNSDVLEIFGTITETNITLSKRLDIRSGTVAAAIIQGAATPKTANGRVFFLSESADIRFDNLIIRHGNLASGDGGGISSVGTLAITNSRLENNHSNSQGGAIATNSSLRIVGTTFFENTANARGGAILTIDDSFYSIDRSTFRDNTAFEGGAIYNTGTQRVNNGLFIQRSTFSRNNAANGGGGILSDAEAQVLDSTFSENSLRAIQSNGGNFKIQNSILANSSNSADCAVFNGAVITDDGNNLVESQGSCTFGNSQVNIDPLLTDFGDFGGLTNVYSLAEGSPAFNAGASLGSLDQRGLSRNQLGSPDIGAVEVVTRQNSTPDVTLNAPTFAPETDGIAGETVSLSVAINDPDNDVITTQWFADGVLVATGLEVTIRLRDGSNQISVSTTDSNGNRDGIGRIVAVGEPPIPAGWPDHFNGVRPDQSLGLSFNNISEYRTTDFTLYACVEVRNFGQPGQINGVSQFDVALSLVENVNGQIIVTNAKPFNATKSLTVARELPDCSGSFETATNRYTDTIQVGDQTFRAIFDIVDPDTLTFRLTQLTEF